MSDSDSDDGEVVLDAEDIVQIIDLDDLVGNGAPPGDDDEGWETENEVDEEEMDDGSDVAGASATRITPSRDDSCLTFSEHKNDAVISVKINPADVSMVVTGGQDDQALVWNAKDGSVMFACTGHTDTVTNVDFSHDGLLLATADMKGLIKVWSTKDGSEVWSFEASDIEWITWHQAAPVLLAGTQDGQVWMWKIPSGDCKTFTGYGPPALCGKILPDGKRACVGYHDSVMKIWDLKSTEALFSVSGHDAHKEPIFCMDNNSDGSLVATGSGDMTVKIVSTSTGKVVTTLKCSSNPEEEDSVEAVGFCKTQDYLATGTLSGNLEIWDLPSKSVRNKCKHPNGIVKLKWSTSSPVFYTICLDGCLRQFDGRNGALLKTFEGHSAAILDFDISKDESFIVTSSDDFTAKVFNLS